MKRLAPALAVAMLATACAGGSGGQGRDARALASGKLAANPSALIAAEIAFNRMAQEQGQWTTFREYAAPDAVMFVPQTVNAADWLKGRADPPASVEWQPHEAWISCDGSLGAARGAWQQPDGSTGYFTTVWQRQKDGDYKWVMDQGDALTNPLKAPDMLSATVADCTKPPAPRPTPQWIDGDIRGGAANDQTLAWMTRVRPDNSRSVSVEYWDGSRWQNVIQSQVMP